MLRERFKEVCATHEDPLRNRAVWALFVYWYGVWALERKNRITRWINSKIYGVLKVISEITSGVHLDRHAKIGRRFHIVHASSIFIHPDVVMGDDCGVMHNITIGTNMGPEVPEIGNDVFIGCSASVLGKIKIGDGARIAANSLVISDVPAGAFAVGVPARVIGARGVYKNKENATPSPVSE